MYRLKREIAKPSANRPARTPRIKPRFVAIEEPTSVVSVAMRVSVVDADMLFS